MSNNTLNSPHRIQSIDLLRGIVMVIMALDHTRDFFHYSESALAGSSVALNPTNLSTTTPFLFFTRWITHFCAPVFVFLAGTSASLMSVRKSRKELASFLLKRGIWLIVLEFTVVAFGWTFDPGHHVIFLQVIWTIGISMVLLGLMVATLSTRLILVIGAIIVMGHNLLNFPALAQWLGKGFWNDLLFNGLFSYYPITEARGLLIIYAFVPWFGVICLGYGFGAWFLRFTDSDARSKALIRLGLAVTGLFFLLRILNIYGDPVPWAVQERGPVFTLLSFFNTNKYPPSLQYLCMTLGPAMMAMGWFDRKRFQENNPFLHVGKVPLFFYVLHFYLLHIMVVIVFFIKGFGEKDIVSPDSPFLFVPPGLGFELPGVYLIWIGVVILLYPLCRWFSRYKSTHRQWWLSYL